MAFLLRRSEVKSQVDGVSVRVERVERELEYLENKIPAQSDIEMEETLLEQQIKAAELDLLKKKAKIKVEHGRKYSVGEADNDYNTLYIRSSGRGL